MNSNARALLVTADAELRAGVAAALAAEGLVVAEAASSREALTALDHGPVALALVDARLPRTSGFDLARKLLALPAGIRPSVLVTTETPWPEERRAAVIQQLGLLDLVPRPLDPRLVAERLLAALPESSAAADPPLRGQLTRTPLPWVLGELVRRQGTGALLLHDDGKKKIATFEQGVPVWVRSNQLSECLGLVLVREGLISGGQCRESLRLMRTSGGQQGEILQQMGAISRRELAVGLALQLRTKLLEVFHWPDGRFLFRPDARPVEQRIRVDWSPADLVAEGVRQAWTEPHLRAALDPLLDRVLLPNPDPRLRFQPLVLEDEQQRVLDGVDEIRTLREILSDTPAAPRVALAVALTLLATGVVVPRGV